MTTLETCLSITLLCWAVAGLAFAWNQYKESGAWGLDDDKGRKPDDDADFWKK